MGKVKELLLDQDCQLHGVEDVLRIDQQFELQRLNKDLKENQAKLEQAGVENALLTIKPVNAWMAEAQSRAVPRMLFDEFWFEGEVCILFADTNVGKSILAVQIGASISSGIAIPKFRLEADKQRVLYFDFELSSKQFQLRYSKSGEHMYTFDENFLRVEINPGADISDGHDFEDVLVANIEKALDTTGARVIIIDNITYLKNEQEKSKNALPLMKKLKTLTVKYELSILIIAHTPKRDASKPITKNDLGGSKMLINFCDSCFAIGQSQSEDQVKYLKQIKVRAVEHRYGMENVYTCQIEKPSNFLRFTFSDTASEYEHLASAVSAFTEDKRLEVIQLYKDGMPYRDIAKKVNASLARVQRVIQKASAGDAALGPRKPAKASSPANRAVMSTVSPVSAVSRS